jgi:hypothetical protein
MPQPGAQRWDRERTRVSGRGWMELCVGERRAGGRIGRVGAWSGGHVRSRRRRRACRRCGVRGLSGGAHRCVRSEA